jgi:hypothetical protein
MNIPNAYGALASRVFNVVKDGVMMPPPSPIPGVFSARLAGIRERIGKLVVKTPRFTPIQFLDTYSGRRRTIYEQAFASLARTPVQRRDASINAFVKCEKILEKPGKELVPRLIQPRHPRYNASVGVYIKPIEGQMYKILRKMTQCKLPVVLKGLNAKQSGEVFKAKWDRFRNPVAVGFDANRFDQHVSKQALEWEHSVYELFYDGVDKAELQRLLTWQVKNFGRVSAPDGFLTYRVTGCRMSGDMNTSLGNCLIMVSLVFHIVETLGIKVWELANNGDDCVLIVEEQDLRLLEEVPQMLLDFGFSVTMEPPVRELESVEFCQTHPVECADGWRMVRNLEATLSKDATTMLPVEVGDGLRAYFKAIGDCGLALTYGVPVFQEYYSMLIRSGVESNVTKATSWDCGMVRLATGMAAMDLEITPAVRVSFWKAFGVAPDAQLALEKAYAETTLMITGLSTVRLPPRLLLAEPHPAHIAL